MKSGLLNERGDLLKKSLFCGATGVKSFDFRRRKQGKKKYQIRGGNEGANRTNFPWRGKKRSSKGCH